SFRLRRISTGRRGRSSACSNTPVITAPSLLAPCRPDASPSSVVRLVLGGCLPVVVEGNVVSPEPAMDLHSGLAEFTTDGSDVPLVAVEQGAQVLLARGTSDRVTRRVDPDRPRPVVRHVLADLVG